MGEIEGDNLDEIDEDEEEDDDEENEILAEDLSKQQKLDEGRFLQQPNKNENCTTGGYNNDNCNV
jgi:hypothetical protein